VIKPVVLDSQINYLVVTKKDWFMMREIMRAVRVTLILWVITAVIYPLVLLIIGQFGFSYQANGSLLKNQQGEVIGSALIGQNFTSNKYFWSRPSTTNYSSFTEKEREPKKVEQKTGTSGGSNLAPSNPDLLKQVQERVENLTKANIKPTADLVYTSASSLDPHITIDAAKSQIERVTKARNIPKNQIETLIFQYTDGRFLGIFGEPGVNVLKLNLALDSL
jgi:K+-transporting ATPase ATPase C chain